MDTPLTILSHVLPLIDSINAIQVWHFKANLDKIFLAPSVESDSEDAEEDGNDEE
jgi:hypothetical protein